MIVVITSVGLKTSSPATSSFGSKDTEKTPGFIRVNV